MTKTAEKTFTKKEYEDHGDTLYEIGKADAFQSVLKTEVRWSLWESGKNKHWDLNTIIIGDGKLKNIPFEYRVFTGEQDKDGEWIYKNVNTIAKDGTVKEVWLAADRAYKKAWKLYGRWHNFLETLSFDNGIISPYFGS